MTRSRDFLCRWIIIDENTEYRIQNTEHRTQNTEYRIQNTEYRTQNTEHRIQEASVDLINGLVKGGLQVAIYVGDIKLFADAF